MASTKIQPTKRGADKNRLNPQQRMFVEYLLSDPEFNATEAARKAGYKAPSAAGRNLLSHKVVRAHVGKKIAEREERVGLHKDDVIKELMYLAFSNPKDFFNDDGTCRPISELPESAARALQGFDVETREITDRNGETTVTTKVNYKLWSKPVALELLGKHLMMWVEQHTHTLDATPAFLAQLVEGLNKAPSNIVDGSVVESRLLEQSNSPNLVSGNVTEVPVSR